MKSLKQLIIESRKSAFDGSDFFGKYYYDKLNYKYYNEESGLPSLEELEEAYGTTANATGDPSFLDVNGVSFTKIKDNQWQASATLSRAIGGLKTNKEILKLLQDTENPWYVMLRNKD